MLPSVRVGLIAVLAAVVFGLGFGAASAWNQKRYAALESRFMDYQLKQANATAQATRDALESLEKSAAETKEIDHAAKEKALLDAGTIADLHQRYDRLRLSRPHCASTAAVSEAPSTSERDGTGSGARFLDANGRSFIEIAADAERVRTQLKGCQAVLRALN
jgi:hypothetical protein